MKILSTGSSLWIKYKVLSLTYKSLKTGQPSYLLSFPAHRCTQSSSLITLSRPSLTFCLKIANRSFYHSAPVLWNNLPSHLRLIFHHVTPFISNSLVSDLLTSLFFKKLKTHSFTLLFLLSLYSPRLSQDWYLQYWPSFVFSSHTHSLSFTVISFTPIFMLFDL